MTGWRCRRRHVHVWSVLLSFLPDDANEALASQACFRARVVVRSTRKKSRAKQISSNSNERSSCLLFVFCFLSVVCGLWSVSFHVEGHQRRCGGGIKEG